MQIYPEETSPNCEKNLRLRYKDLKGMKFPAPYYMALALSVDVAYFLTMAEGGYGT
jgi:hypothetical protein